jgi:hypothetical protein
MQNHESHTQTNTSFSSGSQQNALNCDYLSHYLLPNFYKTANIIHSDYDEFVQKFSRNINNINQILAAYSFYPSELIPLLSQFMLYFQVIQDIESESNVFKQMVDGLAASLYKAKREEKAMKGDRVPANREVLDKVISSFFDFYEAKDVGKHTYKAILIILFFFKKYLLFRCIL